LENSLIAEVFLEDYLAKWKTDGVDQSLLATATSTTANDCLPWSEFAIDESCSDIEIGKGAAQWVTNARAMVRPAITYGLFLMFAFVEVFGFWFAYHKDVPFDVALNLLWDDETQIIWASVVSFWFGTQAFKK
jgi:hypothetical protein